MKEAAGEANLTVIAIILIGVIAAVVTPIINSTMTTTAKRSCCQNYGGVWKSNRCYETTATGAQGAQIGDATYWDAASKSCK